MGALGDAQLLYDDAAWPHLDDTLLEAKNGDSGGLFEEVDNLLGRQPQDDERPQAVDAGYIINCNDRTPGPEEPDIKSAAMQLITDHQIFGALGSWGLLECSSWAADRHVLEAPTAPTTPDLLVIGTVHDPATPYEGAVTLTETLGSATLLTWEGEGHTAYGHSECINALVDTYLIARLSNGYSDGWRPTRAQLIRYIQNEFGVTAHDEHGPQLSPDLPGRTTPGPGWPVLRPRESDRRPRW
jgi:hypothetical protein